MKSHAERCVPADHSTFTRRMVVRLIENAIKDEREACAEIAEAIDSKRGNEQIIADAIRARS